MFVISKYVFEEFIIQNFVTRIGNKAIIFTHEINEMMIMIQEKTFNYQLFDKLLLLFLNIKQ